MTGRQPFAMQAAKIFSLSKDKKIRVLISPLIFSNCYYILRKVAKHEKVIAKLIDLLDIVDVTRLNKSGVELALKSNFKNFEDALQHFSAIDNGKIDVLITRNFKDYKNSEIAVMSPDTYLKSFTVGI